MKKTILLAFIALSTVSFCSSQEWLTSFEEAKKEAIENDKMLFIRVINSEFWTNKKYLIIKNDSVNRFIWDNFIPVAIDKTNKGILAEHYYLKKGYLIMDINSKIINRSTEIPIFIEYYNSRWSKGPGAPYFIKKVQPYANNTIFLRQELINYSNNRNFNTSFALASKYMDFAIFSDRKIRSEILKLANDYFNEAKRLIKGNVQQNKTVLKQIIKLFKIQEKLILNKPNKAFKFLDKIDPNKIIKVNQSLYDFLNYTTFKSLKDEENAALWKIKLTSVDLKKAELILNNNSQ